MPQQNLAAHFHVLGAHQDRCWCVGRVFAPRVPHGSLVRQAAQRPSFSYDRRARALAARPPPDDDYRPAANQIPCPKAPPMTMLKARNILSITVAVLAVIVVIVWVANR
jgi:hypothetical protein